MQKRFLHYRLIRRYREKACQQSKICRFLLCILGQSELWKHTIHNKIQQWKYQYKSSGKLVISPSCDIDNKQRLDYKRWLGYGNRISDCNASKNSR